MIPRFPFRPRGLGARAISSAIRRAFKAAALDPRSGPPPDPLAALNELLRRTRAEGRSGPRAPVPGAPPAPPARGRFETHPWGPAAGQRRCKVYLPPELPAAPPLLVMLHGCTQSADDFAAGTQMNQQADAQGFVVVYPEQSAQANASTCWNWFQPQDQQRDRGEPALIAALVRELARRHGADPGRIFVAGLSAGAAMAVVLGETHPDLFAGVGAHSGLPYGSAHDLPSALMAMKGGRGAMAGLPQGMPGGPPGAGAQRRAVQPVPVIVFHGDRDHTVQADNGQRIVQQALDAHTARSGELQARHETGVAPGGGRFSRRTHADAAGRMRVEHWTLHGAGHAWSGGHASGSYTDPRGPDASAAMLRFFLGLAGGTA